MIPVRKTDVVIGRPLPYSLFDQDNNLLLREGVVVQTQNQLDQLSVRGLYRDKRPSSENNARGVIAPDADKDADKSQEARVGLDEVRLQIGETMQLQTQDEQSIQRYAVKLIGFVKGKSVLVTAPVVDSSYVLVRPGTAFVVRMFAGRHAYAFATNVLKVVHSPIAYLHLSYPSVVRGMVVRRGQRASVRIIAAVTDPRNVQHAGTLLNLSKGGAMLGSRVQLGEKGDPLKLKFKITLDELEQFVSIDAVIRAVNISTGNDAEPAQFQHGLEFTAIPDEDKMALTAFVYQALLADSASA